METTAAAPELADVIAGAREDASVLRRRGHTNDAILLEQLADDVAEAGAELLEWVAEDDAALQSGWSVTKVRRHARAFANTPHVRYEGRRVLLRACIVPRAVPASILRAAGERAA